MERREFLFGTVGLVIASAASRARAEHHEGHGAMAAVAAAAHDPKLERIAETSLDCVRTGEVCVRHCVDRLAAGEKTLEACMRSVLDLVAVCESMASVAARASTPPTKTLRAYIAACAQYCRDCAAACKEHAQHHEACKACMDSCNECVKACEALA